MIYPREFVNACQMVHCPVHQVLNFHLAGVDPFTATERERLGRRMASADKNKRDSSKVWPFPDKFKHRKSGKIRQFVLAKNYLWR